MEAYLVVVKDRTLETPAQEAVEDRTLFYGKEAMNRYVERLTSPPVSFVRRQLGVYVVDVQVVGELN